MAEVKDGLPSTDFSRMNREYIKAVAENAAGGGGGGGGLPEITESDEGKVLTVENGEAAWAEGGSDIVVINARVDYTSPVPDLSYAYDLIIDEGISVETIYSAIETHSPIFLRIYPNEDDMNPGIEHQTDAFLLIYDAKCGTANNIPGFSVSFYDLLVGNFIDVDLYTIYSDAGTIKGTIERTSYSGITPA